MFPEIQFDGECFMKKLVALIFIFSFLLLISCGNENNLNKDNDNEASDETGEITDENPDELSDDDVEYKCLHHCWDNPYNEDLKLSENRFSESGQGVEAVLFDTYTDLEWTKTIGTKTWKDAVDQCEYLTYDGKSDWRLPDVYELMSFSMTSYYSLMAYSDKYQTGWSSSTTQEIENKAWFRFSFSDLTPVLKSESGKFNCVRGKASEYTEEKGRFVVVGKGTLASIYLDKKTGIKWKSERCSPEDASNGWGLYSMLSYITVMNWNKLNPASDLPGIPATILLSAENDLKNGTIINTKDGSISTTDKEGSSQICYLLPGE